LGEAFKGKKLDGLNFTTKCSLGTLADEQVYDRLNLSLTKSLENMNMEKVNLFLLHSQLREDDFKLSNFNEMREKNSTSLSSYFNAVIPAFEKLKQEGKIDHWGIGGLGQNEALVKAINHEIPPEAIQCVLNPLNSAGAIAYVDENFDPTAILKESQKNNLPILSIRAVQAGALTGSMDREPHSSGFDHKDFDDYVRAAPFRELASKWDESPASLAHRYALSVSKVGSVILGVKNRIELKECIKAEEKGELATEQFSALKNLF
jgi:aryl-alcohol dehydrogenase-like predicted oxidoreductase